MSLVGRVGRKRPRARLAMAVLYLLLVLGAVTTVYPFLSMVSTGMKGPTDQDDGKLVPAFWSDLAALEEKYLTEKYAGDLSMMASYSIGAEADEVTLAEYELLLMALPPDQWVAGFRNPPNNVTGRLQLRYQGWLRERFDGDIEALNQSYSELNQAFQTVVPPNELLFRPDWKPKEGQKWLDWLEFKATLPAEFRIPVRWQRVFQEWLRSKYEGRLDDVPETIRGDADSFETIATGLFTRDDYGLAFEFESNGVPTALKETTPEQRWLQSQSGPLPVRAFDRAVLHANESEVKREMSTRNYRYVLDYIAVNGRALWNTVIFCTLAVLIQLTVNPLAAYALARFPMKATAKVLVFLLATMAFPAEVAMIPAFLLLKNLGLLNTFAALVLPTAANGYMIFLLKGFFESLPKEVFESGQIDGASEWRMMMRLALPLSKPVMGYMGLLAFMGAYGAFLYAFLVAQDRDVWTLMVFIYQLQQIAPKSVMMAAVTLAAVPTIIVFLFAQRVIMRGIVLPGER
ncbi:MAG: carbohydrate ABC transporter permease [Fimbriimonadaceae bacterium]